MGPAADSFAAGGVLYECLSGQPPFAAENPAVPAQIQALVQDLLAKEAEQRLPSVAELLCRLDRILARPESRW